MEKKLIILTPSGAALSTCGNYRYALWRVWDDTLPQVMFIMLNPSTADGDTDDATIRRCIAFAEDWGYGGILVGNLFAYRCTKPKELLSLDIDAGGPDNLRYVCAMWERVDTIICAWGNKPILNKLKSPFSKVAEGYPKDDKLHYLELSKDGIPKHPLYLKGDLKPVKWAK